MSRLNGLFYCEEIQFLHRKSSTDINCYIGYVIC